MKKMLTLRKDELLVTLVLYLLIGIIMGIVMDVVASFDVEENNSVPNFVGIMLVVSLAMIGIIMHMVCLRNHFNLVIGMGQTRKEFLKNYMIISAAFLLLNLVIVYFVAGVEHLVLSNISLGEAVYEEIIFSFLFSPWIVVYVILTFAVEIFLAAVMMRWGTKGIWGLYGIGIGFLFAGRVLRHGKIPEVVLTIGKFFEYIGVAGIVGILVLVAVGLLVSAVKMLMKQQVIA